MGVAVSIAADRRPIGRSAEEVVVIDADGLERSRTIVPHANPVVLDVVQFVDLDDGTRLTSEVLGDMTMSVPATFSRNQVLADLREMIYEDELRAAVKEVADEPRWEDVGVLLQTRGVAADDASLAAMPFVVELGDDVVERFGWTSP